MSNEFVWGNVDDSPQWFKRHEPEREGHQLFVVRGGNVVFPSRPTWILPLSRITAVGYLATLPFDFRVEVDSVTSSDAIALRCELRLTIALRDDYSSRNQAARLRNSLSNLVHRKVEPAVKDLVAEFRHEDIKGVTAALRRSLKEVLDEALSSTPYLLEDAHLRSTVANVADVDEVFVKAKSDTVKRSHLVESFGVETDLLKMQRARERAFEKTDLKQNALRENAKLELEERRAESRARQRTVEEETRILLADKDRQLRLDGIERALRAGPNALHALDALVAGQEPGSFESLVRARAAALSDQERQMFADQLKAAKVHGESDGLKHVIDRFFVVQTSAGGQTH